MEEDRKVSAVEKHSVPTVHDILTQCHGGRSGHFGERRTWEILNKFFPGHKIPYRLIRDFIDRCVTCQKDRLAMTTEIQPIVRHLKPEHLRSVVGIDTLAVTEDDYGNTCIHTIVNHFSKLVALYPSKDHSAIALATSLFQYCGTYGTFDTLLSDPGSDLMSEVIAHLNRWFGIHHRVSLVDRHESNGVEGTNKQVLRH